MMKDTASNSSPKRATEKRCKQSNDHGESTKIDRPPVPALVRHRALAGNVKGPIERPRRRSRVLLESKLDGGCLLYRLTPRESRRGQIGDPPGLANSD
jgi:hypothetical protein